MRPLTLRPIQKPMVDFARRTMRTVHVELKEANAFIARFHRHHKPCVGHRFSIGAVSELGLCGVVVVGRPVARHTNQSSIVEVTRLCSDGTPNACSYLYQAAARAAKALGYARIQTFILISESGVSLKACGWIRGHTSRGGSGWQSRDNRRSDQPTEPKVLWYKWLDEILA